jgi:hypothetical protein
MTIITLFIEEFNRLQTIVLYGPQVIPKWHPLFGKRYWRCGWYIRKLILYDKRVISIVIYRFYCPETRTTYSLLPFFINRYERHINTVIEDVLIRYFLENASTEALAEEPAPSPWTIRRWIKKLQDKLTGIRQSVEEFLITNNQEYHPTAAWINSFAYIFNDLLQKVNQLPIQKKHLALYGPISYLQYIAAVQNPDF